MIFVGPVWFSCALCGLFLGLAFRATTRAEEGLGRRGAGAFWSEGAEVGEDVEEEGGGVCGGVGGGGVEALGAVEVAGGSEGFDDAVGEEEEAVAGFEVEGVVDVGFIVGDAEGE